MAKSDDGSSGRGSRLPDPSPEEAEIREYVDTVTYNGPYWYVRCPRENEGSSDLTFDVAEFDQPLDELPEKVAERLLDVGMVNYESRTFEGRTWDGHVEQIDIVPDAALELLSEEFDVLGYDTDDGDNEDGGDRDPESWLYDGYCLECGEAVCIEVLGRNDLCYECGAEIPADGSADGDQPVTDGGHRHATDRVDGVIVAECQNGCDLSVTVEYEAALDNDVLEDLKEVIGSCADCGAEMAYVQQEEPSEVLD